MNEKIYNLLSGYLGEGLNLGQKLSHMLQQMAGVMCQVADGIATIGLGVW